MEEQWKDIDGYNGDYQISNMGRVKSFKKGREFIRKPYLNKNVGYFYISLYKNNNKKSYRRCRLVAKYFVDNPQNKPDVNHKDGNKQNDYYKNLEWVTPKENMNHAVKNGLHDVKGSKNPRSKLSKNDVMIIKERLANGETHREIAIDFNVNRKAITKISTGRRWGWL